MDHLARYILESYANENTVGSFGDKLLESATNNMDNKDDDEMAVAINYLNECEAANNLLWIDFYSWNNLPLLTRNKIHEEINVFEWSAAYMSKTDFEKIRDIFNGLDNYIFYVLDLGTYYRVVILGGDCDSIYTKDKDYLKLVSDTIKESLVYKFSTDS